MVLLDFSDFLSIKVKFSQMDSKQKIPAFDAKLKQRNLKPIETF